MNRMTEVHEMIREFLAGSYDPLAFSYDLPFCLCEYYDDMHSEDPTITELLNEELPEICADYERGADPAPFMAAVKREYERAMAAG